MMKKLLATGVAAAFLASGAAQAQLKNLTGDTGSELSVSGNVMLALSEVLSTSRVASLQVTTGQTLTNAIMNVATGKTDIGSAPFVLTFLLANGAGPYSKTGKKKGAKLASNLSVLYTYSFGSYALYAYDSKNFGGWKDIKGKTIYNGPPRGGALNNSRAIIKIATGLDDGKGYKGLQVNWGQAVKTITDGSSDAMILPATFPDGRISQALASGNITIWSFPKTIFQTKAAQAYANSPGSGPIVWPINKMGYKKGVKVISEDNMFRSFGILGGDVVNKSMDFKTAKAITAAVIKGLNTFHKKSPFMPNVQIGLIEDPAKTGMCARDSLKYHPGAVAAWTEAGFKVPDCAKP